MRDLPTPADPAAEAPHLAAERGRVGEGLGAVGLLACGAAGVILGVDEFVTLPDAVAIASLGVLGLGLVTVTVTSFVTARRSRLPVHRALRRSARTAWDWFWFWF